MSTATNSSLLFLLRALGLAPIPPLPIQTWSRSPLRDHFYRISTPGQTRTVSATQCASFAGTARTVRAKVHREADGHHRVIQVEPAVAEPQTT